MAVRTGSADTWPLRALARPLPHCLARRLSAPESLKRPPIPYVPKSERLVPSAAEIAALGALQAPQLVLIQAGEIQTRMPSRSMRDSVDLREEGETRAWECRCHGRRDMRCFSVRRLCVQGVRWHKRGVSQL